MVKAKGITFRNFVENPQKKEINTGIYVFDPKIVNFVPKKSDIRNSFKS